MKSQVRSFIQRQPSVCWPPEGRFRVQRHCARQVGFLDVTEPPNIDDEATPSEQRIMEKSAMRLSCTATGRPSPKITWRREDRKEIRNGGRLPPPPLIRLRLTMMIAFPQMRVVSLRPNPSIRADAILPACWPLASSRAICAAIRSAVITWARTCASPPTASCRPSASAST